MTWLEWAIDSWKSGDKRVQLTKRVPKDLKAFICEKLECDRAKIWIIRMRPTEETGLAFTHVHRKAVVHYLTEGSPLDLNGELIYPKPGMTILIPADIKHGAYHHPGPGDRIAIGATAA